jgi:Cu/Ag efflux protein CusF
MSIGKAVVLVGALACIGLAQRSSPAAAHCVVAADEHYSARGVVKSFGPKRAYVSIAHEKIPGFMDAMTMSFESRSPEQLAGLEVGQKVAFTFTATADGRRILDGITRL